MGVRWSTMKHMLEAYLTNIINIYICAYMCIDVYTWYTLRLEKSDMFLKNQVFGKRIEQKSALEHFLPFGSDFCFPIQYMILRCSKYFKDIFQYFSTNITKNEKYQKTQSVNKCKITQQKRSDQKLLFKPNCVKKAFAFKSVQNPCKKRSKPFKTVRNYATFYI